MARKKSKKAQRKRLRKMAVRYGVPLAIAGLTGVGLGLLRMGTPLQSDHVEVLLEDSGLWAYIFEGPGDLGWETS